MIVFFLKSFTSRPRCTIWFCFKLVVGGVVSSLPVLYFQGFPEDEWRRGSAVNVWNLWSVLYPRSFLRDFQLPHEINSLSSVKQASTVGGASRAGTVSSLLPGTYRALACENVSSDGWCDGEKGDQKASKSDPSRGQKRPKTMGLKAWLRWRTPFYHRARRSTLLNSQSNFSGLFQPGSFTSPLCCCLVLT